MGVSKMQKLKPVLQEFGRKAYGTVIRHGVDNTGLTKSKIMFGNLFLHTQPVKVHKRTLNFKTTLGAGLITFFLFLILVGTGILLMFHYVPSIHPGPDGLPEAYSRMLNLRSNVFWGVFLRNMHRWAAHGMVAMVIIHVFRVFVTGSYRAPREFNWVIGMICGILTIVLSYTGYLLPWDQLAYWGVKVGTEIAKIAPGGEIIRGLLLGDNEVGGEALIRFYVLHVALLPAVLSIFIGIHFFRIRKDGGLAKPDDTSGEKLVPQSECGEVRNASVFKSARSYQLVEIVKGNEPKVNEEVNQMVFAWPKLIVRELIVFVLVLAVLSVVSLVYDAPLEGPADPIHPTNPAKAPWYFLGLQELVSYHGLLGGVIIPGLLAGLVLLTPYIEIFVETLLGLKRGNISGVYFGKERLLENSLFMTICIAGVLFIIIGSLFRGANWEFVYPWISTVGGH